MAGAEKTPLQASGEGRPKLRDDGVGTDHTHGRSRGESAGGAYPNPHTGKGSQENLDGFMGHGGQSNIDYHGSGRLGDQDVKGQQNHNSPTKNE